MSAPWSDNMVLGLQRAGKTGKADLGVSRPSVVAQCVEFFEVVVVSNDEPDGSRGEETPFVIVEW